MRTRHRLSVASVFIAAITLGAAVGVGSGMGTSHGRSVLADQVNAAAVATGWKRQREPRAGDFWGGCNDARAVGTAPIYKGEPGYRPGMDGDNDGIACEPYSG